jgi:hypothetical protein
MGTKKIKQEKKERKKKKPIRYCAIPRLTCILAI